MSERQRWVFDTSTLVGAALRIGSLPHQALTHALSAGQLCTSEFALAELAKVLMRPKFDRYYPAEIRGEFVAFVRSSSTIIEVPDEFVANVQPQCRDPKDNPFLALIQACEASALISSDDDLLVLNPWNGIPIQSPAAFLQSEGQ